MFFIVSVVLGIKFQLHGETYAKFLYGLHYYAKLVIETVSARAVKVLHPPVGFGLRQSSVVVVNVCTVEIGRAHV